MSKVSKPRSTTNEEVAFIKAASARGFKNNYIMGFIHHPGRSISPAVINDVVEKGKGSEVPEMTQEELEAFISKRLTHFQILRDGADSGPLSKFMVHEELGWALEDQGNLFQDENTRMEFKEQLPVSDQSLAGCLKTMAAFANKNGGYLVFGVENETLKVNGVTRKEWKSFDWDNYSARVMQFFQPSIEWDCRLIEYHDVQLGIVYVEPIDKPPVVSTKDWHGINEATVYQRYARSSQPIRHGDLLRLLERRDKFVVVESQNDGACR